MQPTTSDGAVQTGDAARSRPNSAQPLTAMRPKTPKTMKTGRRQSAPRVSNTHWMPRNANFVAPLSLFITNSPP